MPKTYVISDLHGRFDLLQEAMKKIEEQAPHSEKHTVVTTGDYVDRGFESAQIITYLMNYKSDRFTMVNLMGNHEDMMLEAAHGSARHWLDNGGDSTLFSYGQKEGELYDMGLIFEDHLEWLSELPAFYEDDHRVYVHAGVPNQSVALKDYDTETLMWFRYRGHEDWDYHYNGKTVIHGHTPHTDGPKEYNGRINFDTAAYHTGRLVVGVFDDDKPDMVSTITIQGPTLKEWYEANKAP